MKNINWFNTDGTPLLISGPCSAETEEQVMTAARDLAATGVVKYFRAGIWKPRTMPGTFEGVGKEALQWMKKAKAETGLKTTVEVATAAHVFEAIKAGIDVLWIGARTTVNPFAVQEIAEALEGVDIPVMVKNPINPDINLWKGAIERLKKVGLTRLGMVHRGFSFLGETKFRNRPQWQIAIEMKLAYPDLPMICDPSHICGNRTMIAEVSQKALDLNFNGLMIEAHPTPDEAWSDAKQQITPATLKVIIEALKLPIEKEDNEIIQGELDRLRSDIDQYDHDLLQVLSKRMDVSKKIGIFKKRENMTILQSKRWEEIVTKFIDDGDRIGLSKTFIVKLITAIHDESINQQEEIMRN